jgi:hypothetical protein
LGALEQVGDGPIFRLADAKRIKAANQLSAPPLENPETLVATADLDDVFSPELSQIDALIQRIRNITYLENQAFMNLSADIIEAAGEAADYVRHGLLNETERQSLWKAAQDSASKACDEWHGQDKDVEAPDAPSGFGLGMAHPTAHSSIWAAQALVVRDFMIQRRGEDPKTTDLYSAMTKPWREVMGKVHDDDPREPNEFMDAPIVGNNSQPSPTILLENCAAPVPRAVIILTVPLFDVGAEFVHPDAHDLLAALPGGRRVIFDADHTFDLGATYPFRDIVTRVATEGIEAVAEWLSTEARGQTILIPVTPDEFAGSNGESKIILRLAESLSDRDVATLICAPALTAELSLASGIRTVASSDRVSTIACVALDRMYSGAEELHVQALAVLKAAAGDRLAAFADRFDLNINAGTTPTELAFLGDFPVHVSDFGFSDAHNVRTGYAAVREFALLRADRPQPPTLDHGTGEAIRSLYAEDGLVLPYIPEDFARALRDLGDQHFGSLLRPYDPRSLYMFHEPLNDILKGDWRAKLQFGFNGHGMNSYAYTYLVVADGVAVLGQAFRGLMSADLRKTEREWAQIMDGAQRVHEAARDQGVPAGKLLLIAWSGIRDLTGWVMLDRSLTDPAIPVLHEAPNISDVFEGALAELRRTAAKP